MQTAVGRHARTRCRACRASRKLRVSRAVYSARCSQRHGAILDEGDRLALVLHRHHDVEAGGAHLGDRRLQRRDRAPRPRRPIARRACPRRNRDRPSTPQPAQAGAGFPSDRPRRIRPAAALRASPRTNCSSVGRKIGDVARELDHGAVDEFDRDRLQRDDMLGGVHRLVETAEMADADARGGRAAATASIRCGWKSRACLRSRPADARG